jgi:hypothetical protein
MRSLFWLYPEFNEVESLGLDYPNEKYNGIAILIMIHSTYENSTSCPHLQIF